MPQSRSAATRQRIVDAGVELFSTKGYGDTGLNEIVDMAGVTTGAFYYHFDSKETLAAEILRQGWPPALEVVDSCLNSPSPGLENVITMTFALSALMKRDKTVWISNHLNQSLGLLTEDGRKTFEHKAQTFVNGIAAAIRPGDIKPDVTREEVGNQVWMNLHGCHLLSDAFGDSVSQRLVRSWQILLNSVIPAESLPYFEQFLLRTAEQFPA
jgi:AcrR family transcriptional regulator